jgi:signal transduction histidine kinase/ligand-binding sensor domain-containing protein
MKSLLCLIATMLAFCCAAPAQSAAERGVVSPILPAIPYLHARWLVKDGAPPDVNSLAQTPDGWIWLASSAGLFRFDGATFTKYQPPAGTTIQGAIRAVGVLNDGTLWVAPQFGKLYLLRGAALQVFEHSGEGPKGTVQDVVRDREGRIWLASGLGLQQLNNDAGTWHNASPEIGLPEMAFFRMLLDRRGTLWVQGRTAIFARWPGEKKFVRVANQTGAGQLRQAPDGTVWVSELSGKGLRRLSIERDDPRHRTLMRDVTDVQEFIIDRQGNFWFGSEAGVQRMDMDGPVPYRQEYSTQQGLSGPHGTNVMEDREGNIWVTTSSGLDQFRVPRMKILPLPAYMAEARPILAGQAGELWTDRYFLKNLSSVPERFGPAEAPDNLSTSLYRDPHGVVWTSALDGLWRLDGVTRVRVALPPELAAKVRLPIFSIAMDAEDALWITIGPRGTWRLKDGAWQQFGGVAGLVDLGVTTMQAGPARTLWFASVNNTIAVLRDGIARRFGPNDGIDVGTVLQIVPQGAGAWLGGDSGLAWFDGKRAVPIRGVGTETFMGASGVVLTPEGELWANTALGLISIPAAELTRARANPAYRVQYRRFDENDGLVGTAPSLVPLPSLVRMADGELVVSTNGGVFRFDPARARANNIVPPVHIVGIEADGVTLPSVGPLHLPPGPDSVRIDYTALSLALPQRVRFQYLLDGVDRQWQDAGTRRAAYYTKLAPGRYTFRVIAANDDGVWNRHGALLHFHVLPTITQTVWFKLLCVLVLALLAWALHRLRLRTVLQRQERTFEARVAERERIARDLHDTLLQSVQGLILMFRRIALRTPDTEPAKEQMNVALALAIEVMAEGRDKVQGLRVTGAESAELGAELDAYGRRLAGMHQAAFSLTQPLAVRPLHGAVHDELLALGQEAIRNAFVHAHATHIDVTLDYGDKALHLSVRDDGRGIDPDLQVGRPGHWGIPGMRERAAHLGAEFTLSSPAGEGTLWSLQLSARKAYTQVRGVVASSSQMHGETT